MPLLPELLTMGTPGEEIPPPPAPISKAKTASLFGTQPFGPFIEPLDTWYCDIENLCSVGDANSINIPWLLDLSVSIGNATTQAIGKNAVVFCETEWGEGTGGGFGSLYGSGGVGSGEGGLYVSF